MKRIALLLAGAVLGSGCIVDTCDERTLTVDWSFVSLAGTPGRFCGEVGVVDVDVYIDDVRQNDFPIPCSDYRAIFYGVPSGSRRVVVEGWGVGGLVNRDAFTASVDSCGNTAYLAEPGEGEIDIAVLGAPADCNGGVLHYLLVDDTFGLGTVVDNYTGSAYPCASGVFLSPVPNGYYTLEWMDEVVSATPVQSTCAPVPIDVWWNTALADVALDALCTP